MAYNTRKLKRLFSRYVQENLLITTSAKYRPEDLLCAVSAVGADRVLFMDLVKRTPLGDTVKDKIYHPAQPHGRN
jgi:hypothetical protein